MHYSPKLINDAILLKTAKMQKLHKTTEMKVAKNVILLLNAGDALATTISACIHPNSNSNIQRIQDSFELPLESYGIKDQKASGEIIHFVDSSGHYEVSFLLLQTYEPPILACALNEVLLQLVGGDLSAMPTLVVPFIVPESKVKQENKYAVKRDKDSVYSISLGPTSEVAQGLSSRVHNCPSSSQIYHEDLAVILHLANAMKLPSVFLIGLTDQPLSNKSSNEYLEVACQIGEHVASALSLVFSKEDMVQNPIKTSREREEAWRALYG